MRDRRTHRITTANRIAGRAVKADENNNVKWNLIDLLGLRTTQWHTCHSVTETSFITELLHFTV